MSKEKMFWIGDVNRFWVLCTHAGCRKDISLGKPCGGRRIHNSMDTRRGRTRKVIRLTFSEKQPFDIYSAITEMIASNEFWLASDVFMGTLILAELMASHLTFSEFNTKVLRRHGRKGTVCFDPKEIPTRFSSFYKVLECGLENNPSDRGTATDILNMLNRIGFPMPDIYPHTFYSYWPQEPYEEKLINEDYDQSNNELMIPTQKPNFNNGYTPKFVSIDSLQLSSSDEEDANVEETHLKSAKQKRHAEKDLSSRQLRLRKDHANDPTELIKRQRLLREINRPFSFGQRR
ncbi:hypothetical protein BX666DRAFT_1362762 [Dichotomocladium elegans]|nr:hypothetical protein BX666DRAFT_1362762 [Dichotomocladium elegans]